MNNPVGHDERRIRRAEYTATLYPESGRGLPLPSDCSAVIGLEWPRITDAGRFADLVSVDEAQRLIWFRDPLRQDPLRPRRRLAEATMVKFVLVYEVYEALARAF